MQIDPSSVARDRRIVRLPRQGKLTRKYLDPSMLLACAREARREADAAFVRRTAGESHDDSYGGELSHPDTYPIGYCHWIRDRVWPQLSADPLIKNLRRQGLTWKKVFFIQDESYFQNAIQCGDVLLDVAHNTIEGNDEPVVITPLADLSYENLDGWPRYASIAEKYYNLRLYPNFYFPLAFPLAPFLALRASGRLELLIQQDMLFLLDLSDRWARGKALLADAAWMDRTLPPVYETLLEQFCGQNDFSVVPLEFRPCSRAEIAEVITNWDDVLALPERDRVATLKKILELTRQAARAINRADLRPSSEMLADLRSRHLIPLPFRAAPLAVEDSLSADQA